jgi:superfamily II DNA or RNA helicase
MSLESKFACFFPDKARENGQQLADSGAVHVYRSSERSAVAEVNGETFHEATVEIVDKELLVDCCCEAAEQGLLCAHAWGTLLICDQHGDLQKAAGRGVRKSARSRYAQQRPTPPPTPESDLRTPQVAPDSIIIDWRAAYADNSLPVDADQLLELIQADRVQLRPQPRKPAQPFRPVPEAGTLSFAFRELEGARFELRNSLKGDAGPVDLSQANVLLDEGYLMLVDRLIALTPDQHFWLAHTLFEPAIWSQAALAKLAAKTQLTSDIPAANFPARFRLRTSQTAPIPQLYVRTAHFKFRGKEQLHAELSFSYGGVRFSEHDKDARSADFARGLIAERDFSAESAFQDQLRELDFRFQERGMTEEYGWKLQPAKLPQVVETLVFAGWEVRAEGKTYRRPSEKKAQVSFKTDWFELQGSVTFGDEELPLPELIALAAKGINTVSLGDGTTGVLPSEWLRSYTMLTEIGETEGDSIRFSRGQFLLVDHLLKEREDLRRDADCEKQAEALRRFTAMAPAEPSDRFHGQLRDYQCEGLGWMQKMAELQLGVCLADDMGLGKTIQILALLADQPGALPSLVVLPKSLVFNWQAEARRFCPHLRVRCYTGAGRKRLRFTDADIVLTTYGTVRRDILTLKDRRFQYCILDESQAIKNIDSQSAKAVRLVQAKHRVCMTGTPIENHIGEMLSQFEFMNPGLLGRLPALKNLAQSTSLSSEQIAELRRAIAPFFLRRTKQQVAKELPDKTVQILYCELRDRERERYDALKLHYQRELLEDADTPGRKPIFQALLRLRQAASHPGLSNPKLRDESSAKQVLIRERLRELVAEGHKVLVFSQFTSMLAIVRAELEALEIGYAYLDGQTQDRDAAVQRFQTDSAITVFLISLKAGGVGLNLTAADYVFLLDPWWNPAIEAQAIDRAYRIGQQKHVFAYKVIAKDTIEEKVLELQQQKQELAEAIFAEDGPSAVRSLTRDDLAFILA